MAKLTSFDILDIGFCLKMKNKSTQLADEI
jgi:hypothetical protein